MNYCIYLKKEEPEVSFKSKEHIFPAALGGIETLPVEMVSNEFNNKISAIELEIIREFFGIARSIQGPGKRGKLNPKEASKSKICIYKTDFGELEIGYLELGKPIGISQIKTNINLNAIEYSSNKNKYEDLNTFISYLNDSYKKIYLYSDEIDLDSWTIGYFDKKIFILKNKDNSKNPDFSIIENLLKNGKIQNIEERTFHTKFEFHSKFNFDNYNRFMAKIAFNFLASKIGQTNIINECFDPIRNFIVDGGENKFVGQIPKEINNLDSSIFPESSHKVILIKRESIISAIVDFYGGFFPVMITLSENAKYIHIPEFTGLIVDWKNRKEYKFLDYIINKMKTT